MPDNAKKPAQTADDIQSSEKVGDLPQKSITDLDATAVKGGAVQPTDFPKKQKV